MSNPLKNCPIPGCCGEGVLYHDNKFVHCDNCDIEIMKVRHWQNIVREGDSPREQLLCGGLTGGKALAERCEQLERELKEEKEGWQRAYGHDVGRLKDDLDAAYAALRALRAHGCECGAHVASFTSGKVLNHGPDCPHVDTIKKAREERQAEPDWTHEPDSVMLGSQDDLLKASRIRYEGACNKLSDPIPTRDTAEETLHSLVGCVGNLLKNAEKERGYRREMDERVKRLERDMEVHWHTGLGSSAKGLLKDEVPK